MAFPGTKASICKFFFLSGLTLAGFSLFLHPMDPVEFIFTVFSRPQDTFLVIYGYVQTMGFWISAGFMMAGIAGMLLIAVQRWRARQFFSGLKPPHADTVDGEENWMFL